MPLKSLRPFLALIVTGCIGLASVNAPAWSADRVKVGVFANAASLPYFVALKRNYFADEGIDPETVVLGTPALIVQSLVSGSVDATSNLVTMEGANINARRPGTVKYLALIGQNKEHVFEQFVVKPDSKARSLGDLKGAKLFTSPGPANIGISKAVLAKAGLQDGRDYSIQEQALAIQIGAMKSGNFDGGYTIEPTATIMIEAGIAKRLEAGVIADYLIGRKGAEAYAAGPAVSDAFLNSRPEVARRYANAIRRALKDIQTDPSVRDYLVSDMNVPADVVQKVPMPFFKSTRDLTPDDIADFQKFIDVGVGLKVIAAPVDVKTMLAPF